MASGHPKNRLLYSEPSRGHGGKRVRTDDSLDAVTPERLSSANFRKQLKLLHKNQELNRLVIDEAHCISEWGHDFR